MKEIRKKKRNKWEKINLKKTEQDWEKKQGKEEERKKKKIKKNCDKSSIHNLRFQ